MGLIVLVLPLQCILVNTCMHEQPKKWGGGGGGTSTRCPPASYPPALTCHLLMQARNIILFSVILMHMYIVYWYMHMYM